MMDGRQHTMVTGSTASIHGVCLFLSREASKSWEDIQQHGYMQKMHAWLISETSNLDFRKDEKKGAFAVFFAKNQLYHSKANKVFVDVWSKRDT